MGNEQTGCVIDRFPEIETQRHRERREKNAGLKTGHYNGWEIGSRN
jgi:hypothetical protein